MPDQYDITLHAPSPWDTSPLRIKVLFRVMGDLNSQEGGRSTTTKRWVVHVIDVLGVKVDAIPKDQHADILALLKAKLEDATGRSIAGLTFDKLMN